ncbi:hypothetical protein [Corynebacterium hindlerae]|uniref:hypothetical protein n=1 Tax=Corynebacterium hindlerae TaxID=699041 RepID=UPI003AAA8A84
MIPLTRRKRLLTRSLVPMELVELCQSIVVSSGVIDMIHEWRIEEKRYPLRKMAGRSLDVLGRCRWRRRWLSG